MKGSQPQFIVLFDIVVIFLFAFMLQTTPNITYKLPENVLYNGGRILSVGVSSTLYLDNDSQWKPLTKKIIGNIFYDVVDCNYAFCTNVHNPQKNSKLKILISEDISNNASKLSRLACRIDSLSCSNVVISVMENGKLDLKSILKDNSIFKKIDGYEKIFI